MIHGALTPIMVLEPAAKRGGARAQCTRLRRADPKTFAITRRRCGSGFTYVEAASGASLRDAQTVKRIRALTIPPAWGDVRIAVEEAAHIQVVGRDEAGRLQYIYHERWDEIRETRKARRLLCLSKVLARVRDRVAKDLEAEIGTRQAALAAAAALVDETAIRVGGTRHFETSGARGAATLLTQDLEIDGEKLAVDFTGKGGKQHRAEIDSSRLSRILLRIRNLPGSSLFVYREDDGEWQRIRARDINTYLQEASGQPITAKDFRTFHATAFAADALARAEPAASQSARKRVVAAVMREAAKLLGNTATIARKSYVNRTVVHEYMNGRLIKLWCLRGKARRGLTMQETALARLLEKKVRGPVIG